jgi:hypothetical protein
VKLQLPIGAVTFHIVDAKIPFLLCLRDMDRLKVYINNLENAMILKTGERVPVVRRFGHIFLLWDSLFQQFLINSFDCNPCYLTHMELQRLHRRFGHPSVNKLQRVLERAGHEVEKDALEHLTKYCEQCQKYGQAPRRFKFTITDDVDFNASVLLDIFWIPKTQGKPVIHVLDEATNYQAGRFLKDMTSKHVWDSFRMCWIDSYQGPPNQVTVDASKNLVSKEFKDNATAVGTRLKIVPVEAHHSIGKLERYHTIIRKAYNCITTEIPGLDREMALQMSFKATNDSVGPDGLVPTLLVYGAYPRITEYDPPSPTITQRAQAIRTAMDEIRELSAQKVVQDALNTRNGPNTFDFAELPLNSDV